MKACRRLCALVTTISTVIVVLFSFEPGNQNSSVCLKCKLVFCRNYSLDRDWRPDGWFFLHVCKHQKDVTLTFDLHAGVGRLEACGSSEGWHTLASGSTHPEASPWWRRRRHRQQMSFHNVTEKITVQEAPDVRWGEGITHGPCCIDCKIGK